MMHGVVKIALIDDGVDLEDLETTEFIVGGWHADRKGQHKQIVTWYQSEKVRAWSERRKPISGFFFLFFFFF
jgi:hypothetical protein